MRRSSSVLLLAISASVFASQAARGLVFLPDDRISVRPTPGSIYAPIGLVYDERFGGRATGFLISDCEVLTVRHLFRSTRAVVGKRAYFYAGTVDTPRGAESSVAHVVAAGTLSEDSRDLVSVGDWAILRLKKCLGKVLGSMKLASQPPRIGETLQMAGYPVDHPLANGLIVDPACSLKELVDGMVLHDCATQPGNSGSPLFRIATVEGKPKLEVVALGSGAHAYGVPGANLKLPVTQYYTVYANKAVPSVEIVANR